MISKVISVSKKFNIRLDDHFSRLLYLMLIPHVDDFGRMSGDPYDVKALVFPMMEDVRSKDIEASLGKLHEAGLIIWYSVGDEKFIQITNFDAHQQGLKKRIPSKIPAPPSGLSHDVEKRYLTSNNVLSASEAEIEQLLADLLRDNKFIDGETIVSVERQVRIANSYVDILAIGESGRKYLFEVKRQRLSNASIEQVTKYREMLGETGISAILIGNGIASNFDFAKCKAENMNVLTYDDSLMLEEILLIDVKCRQTSLVSEQKRIENEENRREEKERKEVAAATTDELGESQPESFPAAYKRVYQRDLTSFQAEQLGAYIDDEGFEESVIIRAIERSAKKEGGLSLVFKILNDYAAAGAKTLEGAKAFDDQFEANKQRRTHNRGDPSRYGGRKPSMTVVTSEPSGDQPTPEQIAEMRKLVHKLKGRDGGVEVDAR